MGWIRIEILWPWRKTFKPLEMEKGLPEEGEIRKIQKNKLPCGRSHVIRPFEKSNTFRSQYWNFSGLPGKGKEWNQENQAQGDSPGWWLERRRQNQVVGLELGNYGRDRGWMKGGNTIKGPNYSNSPPGLARKRKGVSRGEFLRNTFIFIKNRTFLRPVWAKMKIFGGIFWQKNKKLNCTLNPIPSPRHART